MHVTLIQKKYDKHNVTISQKIIMDQKTVQMNIKQNWRSINSTSLMIICKTKTHGW